MTKSVIDDALLQAMPHIKHTLIQFFWRYEILSGILAVTFLSKYCSLMGSDLDCYGHVTLIFATLRETRYLSKLRLPRLKLS